MLRQLKSLFCFAMMAFAMSAFAFVPPVFQTLETRDHDASDRLVSNENSAATNTTAYGYAPNGNLTNLQSAVVHRQFSYDYANRLAQVSNSLVQVSYLYDASGGRIVRQKLENAQNQTAAFILHYATGADVPLCEVDSAGCTDYIWTPLGLIAQIEADGTAHYIHSDELGNVIAVSDSSGAVIKETCYGPYGDVWAQSGGFDTPWGFGGAYGVYTEPDVNLLHMQARYYSPEMKRFISSDPSGLKGGVNFYTYADGNPLNNIDPEGLCARPSLFGQSSLLRTSSAPSWLSPMQNDLRNLQRYGTPFEDRLRGTMAPGIAAASVFNPSQVAKGIADDYWGNYKSSGSHYNALNLTFNPVVRGFLNASQATDGIGYKYNNAGSRLSTGQRIGSGIGAAFNAAEAVGVGYGGAKLTTSFAPSITRNIGLRQSTIISAERAEQHMLKNGFTTERSRSFLNAFDGPITARIVKPGESFLRYTDVATSRGSFVGRTEFASPAEAVQGLYLKPYGNNASLLQDVTATQRNIVFEGNVANGGRGIRQSLIINRDAFQYGTGKGF